MPSISDIKKLYPEAKNLSDDQIMSVFNEYVMDNVKSVYPEAKGLSQDEVFGVIGNQHRIVKNAGVTGRAKDFGLDVAKGVIGAGESVVGLADLVTGNAAGNFLRDSIGYDPKTSKQMLDSWQSDERQQESRAVQDAKGFVNTLGALVDNPAVAVGAVGESAPLMLGTAGAVRAAATQMLSKAGLVAGTEEAAKFLARPEVASRLALIGSATEGAMTAGNIQETSRQEGRNWSDSAGYAAAGGLGTAAIGRLASKILPDADVLAGTAGLGAKAGAKEGLLSSAKAIGKGIVQEGVLEEMPQSAQEQVASNLALGKPWDEGVSEAAAMGLATGGLMGGGMTAANRFSPAVKTDPFQDFADAVEGTNFNPDATARDAMLDQVQSIDPRLTRIAQAEQTKAAAQQAIATAPTIADAVDAFNVATAAGSSSMVDQSQLLNDVNEATNAPIAAPLAEETTQANDAQVGAEQAAAPLLTVPKQPTTTKPLEQTPVAMQIPKEIADRMAAKTDAELKVTAAAHVDPVVQEAAKQEQAKRAKPIYQWTDDELSDRLQRADSGESPLSQESRAKIKSELAKRVPAAPKVKRETKLSIGSHPTNAEPITVNNGVVYIGKYPAMDYETEEDITVKDGATDEDIVSALRAGGVIGRNKVFGLVKSEKPAAPKKDRKAVYPESDSALVAIAKLGGMDTQQLLTNGFDQSDISVMSRGRTIGKRAMQTGGKIPKNAGQVGKGSMRAKQVGFNMPIHRNGGMSFDGMREALVQYGYLPEDASVNDAIELLNRELRGEPVYTASATERMAQEAEAERQAMMEAEQEASEASGYDGLENTAEERAADALIEELYGAEIAALARGLRVAGYTEEEINAEIESFNKRTSAQNGAKAPQESGRGSGNEESRTDAEVFGGEESEDPFGLGATESADPFDLEGQTNEQAAADFAKQNASNDYLANIVDQETWKAAESLGFELDDSYPYPTAGEMPLIREAFDRFFDTIQTKETDKGVALFSQGQPSANTHTATTLTAALQSLPGVTGKAVRNLTGNLLNVITSDQIPDRVLRDAGVRYSATRVQSENGLPNQADENRVIDGAELKALRRAAASIERPRDGVFLQVTEDGRAIATGPKGTRVPDRFIRFAEENGLTFEARRDGRGRQRAGDYPMGGPISSKTEPMPVSYRESGAMYFGEGNVFYDRTGKTRFSRNTDGIRAYIDPMDGKAYIVADNIPKNWSQDELLGLIEHEVSVHVMAMGQNDADFQKLLNELEVMRKTGSVKAQSARNAVPNGTNPDHVLEEQMAYFIQANPTHSLTKRVIAWLKTAIAKLASGLGLKHQMWVRDWLNAKRESEIIQMAHDALLAAAGSKQHLASVLKTKIVADINGDEIDPALNAEPVDIKAMRKAVKSWAKDNIVGEYRNNISGITLDVRPAGIDQAIYHGGAPDKLKAFAAIPNVLRDGVVIYNGKNPKNKQGRLVVIAGKVNIRGESFFVTTGFREDANGRLFYDHELMEVERAERLSSQWGAANLVEHPLPSAHLNDYTASFLSQYGGDDSVKYSFAGKSAATADKYALNTAHERLNAGEDAETVRKETGWFKGADGKWRYEIDDSGATLKKPYPENGARWGDVWKSQVGKGEYSTVGSMLDHPALFSAYPQLADIPVSTKKGAGASYSVESRQIDIGEDVPMYEVVSTLLHEIQHGIQTIEGFASGGNTKNFDYVENSPEYKKWNALRLALPMNPSSKQVSEMMDLYDKIPTRHGAYRRLAGEVEARNVQSRQRLTAEQRREQSPEATQDVTNGDVIVVFNGKEMANAPVPANAPAQPTPLPEETKAQAAQRNAFSLPEWTKADTVQERIQDRYNRIRDVVKAIRSQGLVSDLNNFDMGEDRFHGVAMAKIEAIEEDVLSLLKAAKAADVTLEEATMYAYAEHAPERNKAMQAINPNVQTGSGMSDQEAADIIAKAKQEGKDAALSQIADNMRAIASRTLKAQLDAGLIEQSEYDNYTNKYQKWVPLRGFETIDEQGRTFRGTGKGFNIRGKENLRALGRDSKAGQILENIVMDAERTAIRSTKNVEVNHRFLRFVLDNPDPTLWEIDATKTKQALKNGRVSLDSLIDKGDNTIGVKVNGQVVYVKIHDQKLFEQLANMWDDSEFGAIPYLGEIQRYLAKSYTAWSPEFALFTNPVRDITAALVSITGREGAAMTARFAKNYAAALKAAYQSEVLGKKVPIYAEYEAMGGKTGFWNVSTLQSKKEEIESLIKDMENLKLRNAWRTPLKLAKALEKIVSHHAGALENATRLASYMAMKEAGKSKEEASAFAKNLNVNFNRRGTWTSGLGSIFLFFNPAVQGTHNMYQTLVNGKHNKQAMALMGMGVAGMFMLALMNAGAGEDDDGIAWWDKISDFEKQTNVIIVLPSYMKDIGEQIKDSTGRYIKFPMPYGWNVPFYSGSVAADVMRNTDDPATGLSAGKGSLLLGQAAVKSFNPVGIPQAVAPFWQHYTNTGPFGGRLYPENEWNKNKPGSEKYSAAMQGSPWQEWAEFVNEATGGNKYQAGVVSLPPAVWRNYMRSFIGGPMSFATATSDSITEGDITKAPFIRKAYGEVDFNEDAGKYYDLAKKAEAVFDAAKAAEKAGDVDLAKNIRESDKVMYKLGQATDVYNKRLGETYKKESTLKKRSDMTEKERELALQMNEYRRSNIQEQYLKQWRMEVNGLR